jgi:hypothetical protein
MKRLLLFLLSISSYAWAQIPPAKVMYNMTTESHPIHGSIKVEQFQAHGHGVASYERRIEYWPGNVEVEIEGGTSMIIPAPRSSSRGVPAEIPFGYLKETMIIARARLDALKNESSSSSDKSISGGKWIIKHSTISKEKITHAE